MEAARADTGWGGGKAPKEATEWLALMLNRLTNDPSWADEYNTSVHDKSFASPAERIPFERAIEAVRRLVDRVNSFTRQS